jgi:hypothetical protein
MIGSFTQIPERLLAWAVRRMPAERREWGAAMLAELAQLRHPATRWQFALSCVRVALFPPRRGGFLMDERRKYWLTTVRAAALFGLLMMGTAAFLAFWDTSEIPPGKIPISLLVFCGNWLVFTLILIPLVSGLRAGEPVVMKHLLLPFGAAALFGLLLITPFAYMEYWNNPRIQSGEFRFPFMLFYALWLSPTVFFLAAIPIVRRLRAGESILSHPIPLLLRVAFLALLTLGWVGLLRDQMPCFLGGVPGCD